MLVVAVALIMHAWSPGDAPSRPAIVAYAMQATANVNRAVTGVVRDPVGGIIAGATIVARAGGHEQQTVTDADGRFAVSIEPGIEVVVTVRASGFAEATRTIRAGTGATGLEFVLGPERITEAVTVTATRRERRTSDVPASINVLGHEDIRQSPAVVADDVLRQIPTFSLFRRTSSLASHPTAQGVSLRGIGPSGVSRTLVLLDGVPINDPFGGWVYWSRVPLESVRAHRGRRQIQLEPLRQLRDGRRHQHRHHAPTAPDVRGQVAVRQPQHAQGGLLRQRRVGQARRRGRRQLLRHRRLPDRSRQRARPVDNNAAVEFRNMNVKVDYAPTRSHPGVRARRLFQREPRQRQGQHDRSAPRRRTTRLEDACSGGARVRLPDESDLQATVFGDVETFHSNFLAVPAATPPRSVGRMTLTQTVPTTARRRDGAVVARASDAQFFTAGADWRWVDGDSQENGLDAVTGTQVDPRCASPAARSAAPASTCRTLITPTLALTITLSARVDRWRNYDGHNLENERLIGPPTATTCRRCPIADDMVVSPRAAARYHLTNRVDVWGDVGWGFRAPTLNELYRQFRVGTMLTLANYRARA